MRQAAAAITANFRPSIPAFGKLAEAWKLGDIPILCNLTIRVRFALLVGLAVMGALAFGVVYHLSERSIDAELAAQNQFRRLNDLAGDVRAKAALLRNHEASLLQSRDAKAAEAFHREAAAMGAALGEMGGLVDSEAMAAAVTGLQEGLAAVNGHFAKVEAESLRLGLSDAQGLRGRLRDSVAAMEDELKMWPNAGSLPVTMLQMRQAEKNFMIYGAESALGLHRKFANQFDFEIDASPLPPSTRDDFRRLLAAYVQDMGAFAQGTLALRAEADRLDRAFNAMQPTLQQVFGHARDGMGTAIERQEAVRAQTSRITAMVGVLAVLAFFGASLVLARSVTQPVRLIEHAMDELARGNHRILVPGIERRDEIGDMAKAVAVFKDNAIAMVRMQQEQEAIRAEAEAVQRKRMLAIADHFEQAVKTVADAVGQGSQAIRETAARMAQGSQTGDDGSLSVAEAAEKSRATVAAVAEAAEELAVSVREICGHVAATSQVVRQAVSELERTNQRVRGLADVAGRIDRVVNLIGDIAQRTNMLSLNATIEAQRAGEAGKGFAVVANEVKRLAHQTTESTQEIASQVTAIQAATADTVAAIGDVGAAIRRMDEIAADVSAAVARQAEVTAKIGRCVEEVSHDTRVVTDGVVAVTQSAVRYCGAAVRVMWAAEDLAGPAGTLTHEVDGFLATVRG